MCLFVLVFNKEEPKTFAYFRMYLTQRREGNYTKFWLGNFLERGHLEK